MLIKDRIDLYNKYKLKYLGKSVKDGHYIQCVSLGKDYSLECYKQTLGSFGGSAYSGYENKSKTFNNKWKQVIYSSGIIPVAGDLVFWEPTSTNSFGHIAIASPNSTTDKLTILEQNYVAGNNPNFGKGTGPASITERTRDYKNVIGFWRYMG